MKQKIRNEQGDWEEIDTHCSKCINFPFGQFCDCYCHRWSKP